MPSNNNMKRKFLTFAVFSVIALSFFLGFEETLARGFGWATGFNKLDPETMANHFQTMFENKANLLGISVDKVKNCWAEGKNIWQCAADYGITQEELQQKIKEWRFKELKEQLKILVDKGIITQNQADQRLKWLQNYAQNPQGYGFKRLMRRMPAWKIW